MNTSTENIEFVILVDPSDKELGLMEKYEAHEKGLLHRAFSIFVFNNKNHLMMHKRAESKYHSGGLWTNTCCSHPRKNEELIDAAQRRLNEEMGFDCPLVHQFSFIYKAELENGLFEHELDHVYFGYYDGVPNINNQEVSDWKYMSLDDIEFDLKSHPEIYTSWFKIVFEQIYEKSKLHKV